MNAPCLSDRFPDVSGILGPPPASAGGREGGAIADVAELWGRERALQALRPGFPDTRYDMPAGRMMSFERARHAS